MMFLSYFVFVELVYYCKDYLWQVLLFLHLCFLFQYNLNCLWNTNIFGIFSHVVPRIVGESQKWTVMPLINGEESYTYYNVCINKLGSNFSIILVRI